MKPGIHIIQNELEFVQFPRHEIGWLTFCRSFKIKLDAIALIAVSPRMALDNETLFLLIIDHNGWIFPMPEDVLVSPGYEALENHFHLPDIGKERQQFTHNVHYGREDKIIFPKEHYWKKLFKNDWKLKIRQVYAGFIPKSFFGNFSKKISL